MFKGVKLKAPKASSHPVDVGLRTEAHILSELVRRGYSVLVPFGVNQRYDVVLDQGGRFLRAQCKTGRLRNGVVLFPARSIRSNMNKTLIRDYIGDVEIFLVYCPETDRIYSVPVEDATTTTCTLRVDPTRNGQQRMVRWARDYELPG